MKVIDNNKEKKKLVRVIIGSSETGDSKIKAPTKTITLSETNVLEVYKLIIEVLNGRRSN